MISDSYSFIIYEGERKVTKIIQRPMQCRRGVLDWFIMKDQFKMKHTYDLHKVVGE